MRLHENGITSVGIKKNITQAWKIYQSNLETEYWKNYVNFQCYTMQQKGKKQYPSLAEEKMPTNSDVCISITSVTPKHSKYRGQGDNH